MSKLGQQKNRTEVTTDHVIFISSVLFIRGIVDPD